MTKTFSQFTFIAVLAVLSVVAVSAIVAVGIAPVAEAAGSCGSCGGGGNQGGGDNDHRDDPDPLPPVCNYLRSDKTTLPFGGGTVNLNWSTTRGTAATLTPMGAAVAVNGTKAVAVTNDTTFVLRVTNAAGSASCQVQINVQDQVPAPKCDYLTIAPATLPVGGGNVTLKWETTGATSVTIAPVGGVNLDNTTGRVVPVTKTTTFVLTAKNASGEASCQKTVTVATLTPVPRCDSFTLSPATLPAGGGNVTLNWATTNAGSVTIDNGIGAVSADGSKVVNVTGTKTFTLTAAKAGQDSATCSAKVTVSTPNVISCANNVTFTANPTSLPVGGGNVTLTWSTTGLNNVSVNGINANNGSQAVNVNSNTTYTLTGSANGQSISCPVSVSVATGGGGGGGGGGSSLRCTLRVSDKSITSGEEVTLTWKTTLAREITLKDNHGNIIVKKTDDKDDLDSSIKIRPTKDTTYTLIAERGSRDKECDVKVDVRGGVTVSEIRNQGKVAGIALTQVPYTGFEAGPALTLLFYVLLALWGLFVAYLVVVKKKAS